MTSKICTKRMTCHIKIGEIELLPPLFKVIDKILNSFRWCDAMNIIIIGSAAAPKADKINQDEFKLFIQVLEHAIIQYTWTQIAMDKHKHRLLPTGVHVAFNLVASILKILINNQSSNIIRLAIVVANGHLNPLYTFKWYFSECKHLFLTF